MSDAVDIDYLIVSNFTFKNHSGDNAKIVLPSGSIALVELRIHLHEWN